MISQGNCNESGCQYSTTGVCLDNLGDDCPRILKMIIIPEETDILEVPKIELLNDMEELPENVELLEENLSNLTNQYLCKLTVIIGDPDCGKSTLYASLFDKFHKGGCGGYLFAGTKTPVGFERRCHKARFLSGYEVSKTERTPNFEFSYLHLALRQELMKSPIEHLLFADVNGERFQAARDSDEDMQKMQILKRADHVFLVADGDKLVDNGARHGVKAELINILRRAEKNEMIDPNKGINLLITKWDKLVSAGKSEAVEEFLTSPILKQFNGLIKSILKIASRSQNSEINSGYGIEEFLKIILSKRVNTETTTGFSLSQNQRQFQKFKYYPR